MVVVKVREYQSYASVRVISEMFVSTSCGTMEEEVAESTQPTTPRDADWVRVLFEAGGGWLSAENDVDGEKESSD